MKRILNQILWEATALLFLCLLLLDSKNCIHYASQGLLLWYRNMVPTLFPFMILSGFMVLSGLSFKIGKCLHPLLGILFPLPSQMLYVIFMGFLCGFPMGAKIIADMLTHRQLTLRQAEYLLAFCNNIGPLYMLGYVMTLFPHNNFVFTIAFFYLVPLLYGRILLFFYPDLLQKKEKKTSADVQKDCHVFTNPRTDYAACFLKALTGAIEQITLLGGCMIFFNCFQVLPRFLTHFFSISPNLNASGFINAILTTLIEIGGGLQQLSLETAFTFSDFKTYFLLFFLTFGGLSCIAQTYFIIKNTGLKIRAYCKHKLLQSCFFLFIFFCSP